MTIGAKYNSSLGYGVSLSAADHTGRASEKDSDCGIEVLRGIRARRRFCVCVMASLEDGSICVLEGNSISRMYCEQSCSKPGGAAGSFPELCSMLVKAAYRAGLTDSSGGNHAPCRAIYSAVHLLQGLRLGQDTETWYCRNSQSGQFASGRF